MGSFPNPFEMTIADTFKFKRFVDEQTTISKKMAIRIIEPYVVGKQEKQRDIIEYYLDRDTYSLECFWQLIENLKRDFAVNSDFELDFDFKKDNLQKRDKELETAMIQNESETMEMQNEKKSLENHIKELETKMMQKETEFDEMQEEKLYISGCLKNATENNNSMSRILRAYKICEQEKSSSSIF